MPKPLVSVIIPNYNYARYLGEAIDSVLGQSYDNIEVVVVDDGSTDDSRDVIGHYGERIRSLFQQNAGVSATRNNGVRHTSGEFVAFLDADDVWLPEKVERQVEMFMADADLGLVHVGVAEISADGEVLVERIDGSTENALEDMLMLGRRGILGGGSGAMWRRSAFESVGGFCEHLSTSADWELFVQTACKFAIGFVPQVLLKYRVHGSNMHGDLAAFESDMRFALSRAFSGCPKADKFRSRSIANLHLTLAGSHLAAGHYLAGIKHSIISLIKRPSNIKYFNPATRGRNRRGA